VTSRRFILRAAAPDAIGILADVMGHLASHRLNVVESQDFGDAATKQFFIWAKFEAEEGFNETTFRDGFSVLAERRGIDWSLRAETDQPKALILVSKGDHCLNDLLYRHRRGRLGPQIIQIANGMPIAMIFHSTISPSQKRPKQQPRLSF
jgi:formyltetrahydrofolate deformylase